MPKFIVYTDSTRLEIVADAMESFSGFIEFSHRLKDKVSEYGIYKTIAIVGNNDILAYAEGTDIKEFDLATGEQYIPPPPVSPNE